MANPVRCQIIGLDKLEAKFVALSESVRGDSVAAGLNAAGEIVADRMAKRAPKDTGFLSRHFRRILNMKPFGGVILIGPDPNADYPGRKKE